MIALYILLGLIGLPFSVYFSVKFGRYGYLRATQLYREQQQKNLDLRTHSTHE